MMVFFACALSSSDLSITPTRRANTATELWPPPPRAAKTPGGLAFLDPPYEQGLVPLALLGLVAKGWLVEGAVAVAEVASKEALEPPKGCEIFDERPYGAARLVFLRKV